ncbi:MAG: neuraminidase-like domain-containing protein [Candidatus Nanopelagicales bacterium]
MNRITPDLAPGSAGPAVADLQDGLFWLLEHQGIDLAAADRGELLAGVKRERRSSKYGDFTAKLVAIIQERGHLPSSGDVDRPTAELLNRLLEQTGAFADPSPGSSTTRTLQGGVILDVGAAAAGLPLRLYRRQFGGGSALIAETISDDGGQYQFSYDPGERGWSVEVRSVAADGTETTLSRPLDAVAGQALAQVDLIAPAAVAPSAAEYERLLADLTPHIGTPPALAKAREGDGHGDLTALATATGWDARLTALAATAQKVAADSGLPAAGLYGLFRAGLPTTSQALAQVDPKSVSQALRQLRVQGIVGLDNTQVKAFTEQFSQFAARTRLTTTAPGSTSSYAELLDAAEVGAARDAFAGVFFGQADRTRSSQDIWDSARAAGIAEPAIARLQWQGKLAFLAGNSAPVTKALMTKLSDGPAGAGQRLQSPAALVDAGLYQAKVWREQVRTLARDDAELGELIPANYAGDATADRLDAYAEDMARKIRLSYPTQVVTRMAETGELALGQSATEAVQLLKQASDQGFELGRHSITAYLQQPGHTISGLSEAQLSAGAETVKTLHRVYQVTPSNESMAVLLDLGLTSAYEVSALGYDEFAKLYSDKYFGKFGKWPIGPEIRLVWRKAHQVASMSYNLFGVVKKVDSDPGMLVISGSAQQRTAEMSGLRSALVAYPTMESLFGSLDYCECEHCRSVLSPAAYLVDLLNFSEGEPAAWANFLLRWQERTGTPYTAAHRNPYQALTQRRPDLPHLQLTCENTNTELPYIDLVNEILEYQVAHGALDAGAVRDTGEATSAELLAEPANVASAAYRKLGEARYPLSLPFDLWGETVRRFTAHAEVPLADLLDEFRPTPDLFASGADYDRAAVCAEQLGIGPAERALLTDPDPLSSWWRLYGYPDAASATVAASDPETGQRIDLNSAKALSRRLGLSYKQLVEIVQTRFVNPGLARNPLLTRLPAAMSTVRRYLDAGNTAFLAANRDLLTSALTPPQQARHAALSADDWTRLTALAAFADRVGAYAADFGLTADQVRAQLAAIPAEKVLVLADPDTGANFDATILRFAAGAPADPATFVRLNWFVRLWRRLGWTIEETDTALSRFTPTDHEGLLVFADRPLRTALVYLAHLVSLAADLELAPAARTRLLALWGELPTSGAKSAYSQLFLTRRVLAVDPVFDHPQGDYLAPAWVSAQAVGKPADFPLIKGHLSAIQGALGLTAAQVGEILADFGASLQTAALTLENVSALARFAILGRVLHRTPGELIALKALSGVDPLRALASGPLTQFDQDSPARTCEYAAISRQLEDSDLSLADLEYLVRQRYDPAGKYREDPARDLASLTGLADRLRALRASQAIPTDPATLTEEYLSDLLGQALAHAVAARLLAMLRWAESLSPATKDFFDSELLAREVAPGVRSGFLAAADYPDLFEPPAGLVEVLPADDSAQATAKRAANAALIGAETIRRRTRVAAAFVAARFAQLAAELVSQSLAGLLDADPALVAGLLTDPRLLGSGGRPLVESFTALVSAGLEIDFFTSDDASGARQDTPLLAENPDTTSRQATDSAGDPLPAANSMRAAGVLVVDRSGPYRFTIELAKQNATAALSFAHLPQPAFLSDTALADNAVLGTGAGQFLQLEAGIPYRFSFASSKLAGGRARVLVHSTTATGAPLGSLRMYSPTTLGNAQEAWQRLRSASLLLGGLGLTLSETRYLLSHPAQFGGLSLGDLPISPVGDTAAELSSVRARFAAVRRLADYRKLRNEIAGGSPDLIAVFQANEAPGDRLPAVYDLLAALLRRESSEVAAAAATLWPGGPDFASDEPVARLWRALALAGRFGTTVARVRGWTKIVKPGDEEARASIATDLRETLRARYDTATWQQAVRPISDELRARSRDALVAYVMHAAGLARVEQLYEYLLLDPLMEPVVTTSRIRAAIGSVQLFLTRCLLNLEPLVHPSAIINADQWEWMKRYRVWEANRKIWLFPENWLEPEFRGDKSHLFSELEGKLLANDVSPEIVEDAFLEYLRKLEELARLDIVAMHLQDDVDFTRNTLHVIGRTFSLPHKYFYRRYANRLWSAWEPIEVSIDGDHVMPVMWRDRLYLFWLTFLEQGQASGAGAADTSKPIPLPTIARTLEAQLHWSHLVEGTWSTPQTVGYGLPEDLRIRAGVSAGFTANAVPVWVSVVPDPPTGEETPGNLASAGVYLNLGAPFNKAFHLVSRNSPPEASAARARPTTPFVVGTDAAKVRPTRYIGTNGRLAVSLRTRISSEPAPDAPVTLDLLATAPQFSLLPVNNLITLGVSADAYTGADNPAAVRAALQASIGEIEALLKPSFYADHSTTLFVEPEVIERTIEEWQEWVTTTPVPATSHPEWIDDDRYWKELVQPRYPKPKFTRPDDPLINPLDRITNFGAPHSLVQKLNDGDWLTNPSTGLVFDGQVIGHSGQVGLNLVDSVSAAGLGGTAVAIPIATGSGLATDLVLMPSAGARLDLTDSALLGQGVSLVGPAGLNPATLGSLGAGSAFTTTGIFGPQLGAWS